ncbi:tRNA1(Val) (adenine(37)-N6)-methyltransferase [Oscillibacter sp. GMB15532]|uniref:tRNA1(Val) (adenine(37)-N6)-methyltransferase n=1 Tax=Oscillibacter sp. GMB15532 TaxID=3230022 RepID=UPI0034DFCCC0
MEQWDSLCPGGLRFCWDEYAHKPGTDSFLLGSFPPLRPGLRVCDLGSGTGLLGLLLLQRQPNLHITGVEIQPHAAALSDSAVAENNLGDRLRTLRGDIRQIRALLPAGRFDLCVSNPPYFLDGGGATTPVPSRRTARSETDCTLSDLCRAAAHLLRWSGAFCLVHRPERLCDIICTLRENGLEPKRMQLVEFRPGAAPSLLLVEARRGGKPGLSIEPPLCLTDASGGPSAEYAAAYFRTPEQKENTP